MVPSIEKKHRPLRVKSLLGPRLESNNLLNFLDVLCSGVNWKRRDSWSYSVKRPQFLHQKPHTIVSFSSSPTFTPYIHEVMTASWSNQQDMHACSFRKSVCMFNLSLYGNKSSEHADVRIHDDTWVKSKNKKRKKKRESKIDQFNPNPEQGEKGRQRYQARFEQDRME